MQKEIAIGIDIGGINTDFGLVDREGNCIAKDRITTKDYSTAQDLVDKLYRMIQEEAATHNVKPIGIGVGAPSGNYFTGTIESPANLAEWGKTIPIVELLRNRFEIPAFVTNDAKASAIGEMVYGGAKGMKHFVIITLGTGLGCAIVTNGELLYGHDGMAGEFGHSIIKAGGRVCNCGRRGCLETYASATGIKRTVRELLRTEDVDSTLRDIPFNEIDSKMVCEAAQVRDAIAQEAFQFTGEILGAALANLVAIIRPEAIFLQGGVANAGELIFKPTKAAMEKNLLYLYENKIELLPSSLITNAAIIGASALVWKEFSEKVSE